MFQAVDTKNPAAVQAEVQAVHSDLFPTGDPRFVAWAFDLAATGFSGRHPSFQAIDAQYHDFEHTLQGTLCLVRLLRGRHHGPGQPVVHAVHIVRCGGAVCAAGVGRQLRGLQLPGRHRGP